MDVYTTIVAGIAILLAILLYIMYQSVRGLRRSDERTEKEAMDRIEPPIINNEQISESPNLTFWEKGDPDNFFEFSQITNEPEVIEMAPIINSSEGIESVVITSEKIETPRPGWNIKDIERIGQAYSEKLNLHGIKTTADLLEAGSTRKKRETLAENIGTSQNVILEWVSLSDLLRIKGVGEGHTDLLEEVGVDTVPDLANRNPENLFAKIIEINEEKKLPRKAMSKEQVRDWVEYAKKLPRKIEY